MRHLVSIEADAAVLQALLQVARGHDPIIMITVVDLRRHSPGVSTRFAPMVRPCDHAWHAQLCK